jgi:urease accessory protein
MDADPRPAAAGAGIAALLALADQRLPTGGHVHSGGVEQAVTEGRVVDDASLRDYVVERLETAGLVAAGLAAAAVRVQRDELELLDREADARLPSPTARAASRSQGRGLLRVARATWAEPAAALSWADLGAAPHHAVVLGMAARAAGLTPAAAAMAAAYLTVTGSSTAAQRLLGLDPIAVAAMTLQLSSAGEGVAARAAAAADGPFCDLPDSGSPWIDLLTERHALRSDRLFAS